MHQWNARDYHENSSMQRRLALELIDRLTLKGDEHALDIGCGDGKVTAELARRVPLGLVVGIDSSEEMVRFAHDPRISQLAMLEGDRFEVLDITVREDSELCGIPFRDLPMTGSLIGAIVRDGRAIFPHGEDQLLAGDRAIIFTESSRVGQVEKVL